VTLRVGAAADGDSAAGSEPVGTARDPVASVAGVASCAPSALSVDELLALVGAGADWIWETDCELRFSWISENYKDVTGLDPQSVLGRRRLDFLKQVPARSVSAASHLADLDARRPFRNFVYELKGARPDCRWISISGFPRFNADGSFAGYRGIAHNVTPVAASLDEIEAMQRKPAMQEEKGFAEMLAGERQSGPLTAALDVMKDAFCCYDNEDRLVVYNQAFVSLHAGLADVIRPGVRYEELLDIGIERGLWDMEGLDRDDWRRRALERRREPQWQSSVRTAEGRWIMHREMRTEDGGAIGISSDVTELIRRRDEAEANEAAKNLVLDLKRTLDSLTMGIVLLDSSLKALVVNKAFYDLCGDSVEEFVVGSHFGDLLEASQRKGAYGVPDDQWPGEMAARLAEIEAGDAAPRELTLGGGVTLVYSVTALSGGKRLCCYYDITEMKRREAELGHAKDTAAELFFNLRRLVDSMSIGVLVLDVELKAEIVNRAFYEMWGMQPESTPEGSTLRQIMEASRDVDMHGIQAEAAWQAHIARREADFRDGRGGSHEIAMSNGHTVICTMTRLAGGRVLASYVDVTELKTREAELAEALEKARLAEAVIDGVTYPIFVKDQDLRFVLVNQSFSKLFGQSPAGMVGKVAADFGTAEDVAGYEATERSVLESGISYEAAEDFEFPGIGNARMVRKNRVLTPTGRSYVAGFVFDVTELKRRQSEAEEARKHLAEVLESMPASVLIYDRDDNFVFANRKAHEAMPALGPAWRAGATFRDTFELGHSAGYFRTSGNAEVDALYDVDRERWLAGIVGEYKVRHAEFERRNPDGSWQKVYNMRTDDGLFIGVRVDITELKDRERALGESLRENELFRTLIDNVPVAIYAKRPDLTTFYVNKGWSDLTGFDAATAIGKTDAEIFGPQGEIYMQGDRAALGAMATQVIPETAVAPDGSIKYRIARKSVMTVSDGSLYLIGSTTDVTELKEREKELEEARRKAVLADRAKSEFLANMSHEIRTPMNGVLGMAELLAKSELTPKQRLFTDIIVKSGNALLTIINDLLDFSKIDAGQLVLDAAPFNLAEAIEDVATLVSTRAKEKDLELIVRVHPDCRGMFVGDVGRVRQIITNLLGNAVKFTDAGHVLVDVTGDKHSGRTRLRIAVTDTGIGIPADKLQLVFEKFSQVDGSSTRRHEGTGLGLAISSRLVELMGGEIGVDSVEGKGSTFWFTVTLPDAGESAGRGAPPVVVTGARVRVIDDNAVNRTILSEQMRSWTFDSCAAENGPEGLRVLEAAASFGVAVDCVVLDYQMPGMAGAEVARAIRSTPAIADTPIIMLTSVDQTLVNVDYHELGIDAQLIKPARSSALLEALVDTIQKHRAAANGAREVFAWRAAAAAAEPPTQATLATVAPPPEPPSDNPAATRGEAPAGEHRVDILVAEDNDVNQLVFTQILTDSPYTFQIVANGRLAVESHAAMKPRMILMDVSMPEMNGYEAARAIRAAEARSGAHLPIVGVTAHALKGDRERCLEAGMDDYLPKPISPKALIEKVETWIRPQPARQRGAG
jgi:PAS domain S-box-containing protein